MFTEQRVICKTFKSINTGVSFNKLVNRFIKNPLTRHIIDLVHYTDINRDEDDAMGNECEPIGTSEK